MRFRGAIAEDIGNERNTIPDYKTDRAATTFQRAAQEFKRKTRTFFLRTFPAAS